MKKLKFTLIIFTLLFSLSALSQKKVFTGFKTLTTQSELDAFGAMEYTDIEGWLRIEGDDITNVNALKDLKYIRDSFWITNNPNLEDLTGLKNLDTLGRSRFTTPELRIQNNLNLKNLNGLEGLIKVGKIDIRGNKSLESIYGLRNIESEIFTIDIQDNDSLQSLVGLHNISKVTFNIFLKNNKNLYNVKGLEGLTEVGGNITIQEIPLITNLNPLTNLETMGGYFRITLNEKLESFCGISKLFTSNAPSTLFITSSGNLYNPSSDNLEAGRCSSNINFSLEYPKENDVYVVGRKIRLQFPQDVGIPTDSNIKLSYSFDNNTWVDGGSYTADNNLGEFLVTPNVTQPKDVFIKIQTTVNGNDLSFTSKKVTIQPVNYYENLGFREDGVSEIDFPLEGYKGSDRGWVDVKGSRGHFCLDNFAIDFNYLNYFDKKDLTCGKTILAPFNGKIISIYNGKSINGEDYDSKLLCGGTLDEKYQFAGLHITIQSKENRNFAVIFAHLKNVSDKLSKGMEIKKGTFIGNVGGSGTENAHLHMAAYKNIYDWYPLINVNLTKTNTILEKISNGDTFFNKENIITCNDLIDNSAEVKFINKSNNNYHITSVFVETNAEFINILNSGKNFFLNDFTINFLKNKNISKKRNLENFELMKNVKSIDGSLKISNTNLTNLDDFKNITFIGGDLIISNNSNLSNYCGIFNLINNKGLTGKLIIEDNNENPTSEEILNMTDCKSTLNISDFKNDDFMIFPNPTKSELFIKGNDIYGKVVIYNINGKEIISFNSSDKINLNALSKGVYYLKLKKSNKTITRKFVKK